MTRRRVCPHRPAALSFPGDGNEPGLFAEASKLRCSSYSKAIVLNNNRACATSGTSPPLGATYSRRAAYIVGFQVDSASWSYGALTEQRAAREAYNPKLRQLAGGAVEQLKRHLAAAVERAGLPTTAMRRISAGR